MDVTGSKEVISLVGPKVKSLLGSLSEETLPGPSKCSSRADGSLLANFTGLGLEGTGWSVCRCRR